MELLRVVADRRALPWFVEFLHDDDHDIQYWGAGLVDQLLWQELVQPEEAEVLLALMADHAHEGIREKASFIRGFLERRQRLDTIRSTPADPQPVATTSEGADLGDRMKVYEAAEAARVLDPKLPIYARIDGRSFSTFTRSMRRPFDPRMTAAMIATTRHLVKETDARIGYTQSDETSLVWLYDKPDSEPLFGGKVHKLTSILASMAAASFQHELRQVFQPEDAAQLTAAAPHFDARVFQLPSKSEAVNALLWRALDARKNAMTAAARAVYPAKALHGADQARMRAMLSAKGIDFEGYPDSFKRGTWLRRVTFDRTLTADELERIPAQHRPPPDAPVTRSDVREIAMPEFHTVTNRVEVVFDGAEPRT